MESAAQRSLRRAMEPAAPFWLRLKRRTWHLPFLRLRRPVRLDAAQTLYGDLGLHGGLGDGYLLRCCWLGYLRIQCRLKLAYHYQAFAEEIAGKAFE